MIKAWRNGTFTYFSEVDWNTGAPQRMGWEPESAEFKKEGEIPKKIVEFTSGQKTPPPPKKGEDENLPDNQEDWRLLLDELGIKYHPLAGVKKLRETYLIHKDDDNSK